MASKEMCEWKYDPITGEPLINGWPLYSGLPQRGMKPTQEQVLQWAREAGFSNEVWNYTDSFIRLSELAYEAGRKDENEACAEVCELIRYKGYVPPEDGAAASYYDDASIECADAIRARWKK